MTSVKFNLLETPQNQKPSILDSNKSSKRRSIINLTESTDFHSTKISSKHLQIKRPSIFCSDSNINFNKTNGFRRDVYGNFITKGKKNHKISFLDTITNQKLAEVIVIEREDNTNQKKNEHPICECSVGCIIV